MPSSPLSFRISTLTLLIAIAGGFGYAQQLEGPAGAPAASAEPNTEPSQEEQPGGKPTEDTEITDADDPVVVSQRLLDRDPVWFTRFNAPLSQVIPTDAPLPLEDGDGSCDGGWCFT